MSFDDEMSAAFDACMDEFDSDHEIVNFNDVEVTPVVVDIFSETTENMAGGRLVKIDTNIHLREETRAAHGIEKGAILELPNHGRKVRVMAILDLMAGERTLQCGPLNQR